MKEVWSHQSSQARRLGDIPWPGMSPNSHSNRAAALSAKIGEPEGNLLSSTVSIRLPFSLSNMSKSQMTAYLEFAKQYLKDQDHEEKLFPNLLRPKLNPLRYYMEEF